MPYFVSIHHFLVTKHCHNGMTSPGMLGSFSHPRLDFDEVIFAGAATLRRHADVRYVSCEFGRISKDTSWS